MKRKMFGKEKEGKCLQKLRKLYILKKWGSEATKGVECSRVLSSYEAKFMKGLKIKRKQFFFFIVCEKNAKKIYDYLKKFIDFEWASGAENLLCRIIIEEFEMIWFF